MKNSKQISVILIMIISFILVSVAPAYAKTITLRFAVSERKRPISEELYEWFAKEVVKQTDGRVKIKNYYSQTLCSVKNSAKCIQNGIADIGWITPIYHPGYFMLSLVPRLHDDFFSGTVVELMESWWKLHDRMPAMTEQMVKKKIFPISYVAFQAPQLWLMKPINTIDDLKGRKIRAAGKTQQTVFRNLGAVPTMVSAFETHSALQKGILDGIAMAPVFVVEHFKLHKITKQLVKTDFASGVACWGINLDRYNQLTPEDQKTLRKLGRELAFRFARYADRRQKENLAQVKMDNPKMAFLQLSEADRTKIRNLPQLKEFKARFIGSMEKKGIPMNEALKIWAGIKKNK